jgi:hypothetical protein
MMGFYQTLETLTPKVKKKTLGLSAVRPKSLVCGKIAGLLTSCPKVASRLSIM